MHAHMHMHVRMHACTHACAIAHTHTCAPALSGVTLGSFNHIMLYLKKFDAEISKLSRLALQMPLAQAVHNYLVDSTVWGCCNYFYHNDFNPVLSMHYLIRAWGHTASKPYKTFSECPATIGVLVGLTWHWCPCPCILLVHVGLLPRDVPHPRGLHQCCALRPYILVIWGDLETWDAFMVFSFNRLPNGQKERRPFSDKPCTQFQALCKRLFGGAFRILGVILWCAFGRCIN